MCRHTIYQHSIHILQHNGLKTTFISFAADDVNVSVSNGSEAIDKTKQDFNQLASDASAMAEQAKIAGGNFMDHAKGAAAAAVAAGSAAAENIFDEKMKQTEEVSQWPTASNEHAILPFHFAICRHLIRA